MGTGRGCGAGAVSILIHPLAAKNGRKAKETSEDQKRKKPPGSQRNSPRAPWYGLPGAQLLIVARGDKLLRPPMWIERDHPLLDVGEENLLPFIGGVGVIVRRNQRGHGLFHKAAAGDHSRNQHHRIDDDNIAVFESEAPGQPPDPDIDGNQNDEKPQHHGRKLEEADLYLGADGLCESHHPADNNDCYQARNETSQKARSQIDCTSPFLDCNRSASEVSGAAPQAPDV